MNPPAKARIAGGKRAWSKATTEKENSAIIAPALKRGENEQTSGSVLSESKIVEERRVTSFDGKDLSSRDQDGLVVDDGGSSEVG